MTSPQHPATSASLGVPFYGHHVFRGRSGQNWHCAKPANKVLTGPFHPLPCVLGCPEFLGQAGFILLCPSPCPWLQMAGNLTRIECGPATRPYLALMSPPFLIYPTLSRRPLPYLPYPDDFPWHCQAPAGGSSEGGDSMASLSAAWGQAGVTGRPARRHVGPPPPGRTHRALSSLNSSRTLLSSSCRRARSLATESRVLRASPSSAS